MESRPLNISPVLTCSYIRPTRFISVWFYVKSSTAMAWYRVYKRDIIPRYSDRYQQKCGRILGRNRDKSLKSFPPCYSQSPLLTGFETVCNVNIVYVNLKSENSQDYAQKPQRNCTFMNSASGSFVPKYPRTLVCGVTETGDPLILLVKSHQKPWHEPKCLIFQR